MNHIKEENQDTITIVLVREDFEELQSTLLHTQNFLISIAAGFALQGKSEKFNITYDFVNKLKCWQRNLNNIANFG